MHKPLVIIVIAFLFIAKTVASDLSDGYSSFIKNENVKARDYFISATSSASDKAEANLMLALMAAMDRENEKAFSYFQEFCKNSNNPEPYIQALWHQECVMGYDAIKTEDQLKWIETISAKANMNPTLKAFINEDLAKHYEALDDFKKSRSYLSKIGAVMEWQAVGDFENISACGFDKNYEPIYHPEPQAVFNNKLNAPVRWFDLYKQVPGKWIDFTNNFYCNNTLVFAQTFCKSPDERVVYLRIGTSGSLKLWINDQLLFAEDQERNNGMDTYIVPVKLYKGNNRILFQVGCSKITQCNFMLRPTDGNGNILSNLVFSTKYQTYNKTIQEKPKTIVLEHEKYISNEIAQKPEKLVNYLVLANAYLSNDKTHDAKQILLKALEIAPNNASLLYQMLELHLREKDRTSASMVQEKLKQLDPDNQTILNMLINDAFEKENYTLARQLIENKEKTLLTNHWKIYYNLPNQLESGNNAMDELKKDLLIYKIRLASAENKSDEYQSFINEAYDKYPSDYNFVYQKYLLEKNLKRNQNGAIKVLKKYTDSYFEKNALGVLAGEYMQAGNISKGLDIINKLQQYLPFTDNYYKYLGEFYIQTGNLNLAQQNFQECLKVAPFYGPYHGNYARVLELMGNYSQAIEEIELNLKYQPDDYEQYSKLQKLLKKKEVFDYFTTKDYYALYKNSPGITEYPSDNFISITEENQVVLYANGGSESKHVLMYKALTLKGIDYLKEYAVGYAANEKINIEKAEVLKKNGNRLQAEIKDNQIVFTSLEPGDATLLVYKKQKFISSLLTKNYYDKTPLNTWYPSLNMEVNFLVDTSVVFTSKLLNGDIKPTMSANDNFKLYSWKNSSPKAMALEPYMPVITDICQMLSISTLPDWDYVSKWYWDISNTKAKPDYEVKKLVKTLLDNKTNLTEMQKAQIFYNYIEQNIRYSSVSFRQSGIVPQEASDVLITRIGDCKDLSVLFTAMCREANINANVVLVCRRDNGSECMSLPSFDFDHAIAHAKLDGKDYYIEMTSSYYPFAALGQSLYKAFVLDVDNDTSKMNEPFYLAPTTRKGNKIYRDTKISFSGDNMIREVRTIKTGDQAANSRGFYRDLGKEDREKKFTQAISSDFPNTKLTRLAFDENLNNCSDSLTYIYASTSPKVFTEISKLSIVKLPLTDPIGNMDFLTSEDRIFPIEAWNYTSSDTVVENMTITIPENKQLVEVPKSVNYNCKQANYSIKFTLKGKELNIERVIVFKDDYVPVSDYKEYRSFVELVVKSDTQQIGFK
jgi:tetratricopeptide (TPR) repeat protein